MTLTYTFTQSADEVFDCMTDPDFLVERCIALGETSAECEVEDEGSKTTVSMTRVVTRDLPKVLAKVFEPKQTLVVEENWQTIGDNRIGKSVFKVEGQPVEVHAKFKLAPEGKGCVYSVEHTAKVKIPLIGGTVEKYIVTQIQDGIGKEIDFLKKRLAKKK